LAFQPFVSGGTPRLSPVQPLLQPARQGFHLIGTNWEFTQHLHNNKWGAEGAKALLPLVFLAVLQYIGTKAHKSQCTQKLFWMDKL